MVYEPMLLGAASVRFADSKTKVDLTEEVTLLAPIKDDAVPVDWAEAQEAELTRTILSATRRLARAFGELPPRPARRRITRCGKGVRQRRLQFAETEAVQVHGLRPDFAHRRERRGFSGAVESGCP